MDTAHHAIDFAASKLLPSAVAALLVVGSLSAQAYESSRTGREMGDLTLNSSAIAQYAHVAQASVNTSTQSVAEKFDRAYEVCQPVETQILPGSSGLVPGDALLVHWQNYPKQKIGNGDLSNAKVSVLEQPKYGTLKSIQPKMGDSRSASGPAYFYDVKPGTPNGTEDRVIFLIEIAGKRLKVVERLIMVWNSTPESTDCNGKDYYVKRISQILPMPSQNLAGLFSDQISLYGSPDVYSLLSVGYYSGIRYNFTDLPATALGQTVGEGVSATITLNQNAAGHGWYVGPTPLDNADAYLPTSQAGVWQAKAGTDAAGKMDMLSVLLHEYGHALGLEHSAEAGDFMNASLQPGMRKLPTAEQLEPMCHLVAQLGQLESRVVSPIFQNRYI